MSAPCPWYICEKCGIAYGDPDTSIPIEFRMCIMFGCDGTVHQMSKEELETFEQELSR